MTAAQAREIDRLRTVIAAQERELDHRANIITEQADRIAGLQEAARHAPTPGR